ncbi:MAG: M12 family metallo-peptidase, partial [Flavobacteriales bacterium]
MTHIFRLIGILLPLAAFAQDGPRFVEERIGRERAMGAGFPAMRLFDMQPPGPATDALWSDALSAATVLRYDAAAAAALLAAPPERMALELPRPGGPLVLHLVRSQPLAPAFVVRESATGAAAESEPGAHYQGIVAGVPGSLAAISVFRGEAMGVIGDAGANWVLGPLDGQAQGLHVLYDDARLRAAPQRPCGLVEERAPGYTREELRIAGHPKTIRCVRIYWEAAYDLFQNKGSVANVTNYLTGLFNQMATLYNNDGIQVQLSEIFVWSTPSPYNATSSSGRLSQFGQVRTSFNGDLAHLLDLGNYGGIAWLGTLCGSTSSRMAYSGINASYSNVPTYSWSVEVVTHETGHNLGSRHTHACVWNGNNTAIDGCGQAAGYSEGSCPQGPLPPSSVGGTIMSYCHLTSSTIKFANGFGPQPRAVIVNRVNSALCLAQCGTSCDPPEPLTVSNLTAVSAVLGWANFGMGSYTLRWKPTASGAWTSVTGLTGNSYTLTGLTQQTEYEFQVQSVCSSSSSAFSGSLAFTTPVPCTDAYEPNNTTGAATVVTLPASLNGLISPSGDNDYFRFTTGGAS